MSTCFCCLNGVCGFSGVGMSLVVFCGVNIFLMVVLSTCMCGVSVFVMYLSQLICVSLELLTCLYDVSDVRMFVILVLFTCLCHVGCVSRSV